MKKIMVTMVAMVTAVCANADQKVLWNTDTNSVTHVVILDTTKNQDGTIITNAYTQIGTYKAEKPTVLKSGVLLGDGSKAYIRKDLKPMQAATANAVAINLVDKHSDVVSSWRPWFSKAKKQAWDNIQAVVNDGLSEEVIKDLPEEQKVYSRVLKDLLLLK